MCLFMLEFCFVLVLLGSVICRRSQFLVANASRAKFINLGPVSRGLDQEPSNGKKSSVFNFQILTILARRLFCPFVNESSLNKVGTQKITSEFER